MERTYNIPLRKGFKKAPKYKRAKKAVIVLKEFLARHMKCSLDDIKLGRKLNETIWERGYKYPPHHVKVTAIKDEKGVVKAEIFGFKYEEPIVPEETEEKKQKSEDKNEQENEKENEQENEKENEKEKDHSEKEGKEIKENKAERKEKIKKERATEKKDASKGKEEKKEIKKPKESEAVKENKQRKSKKE